MCQPRFAVLPGHEHKAFIPYTGLFPKTSNHAVIQARALSLQPHHIQLDREWQGSTQIPFEYLVAATGTRLVEPAGMRNDDKLSSVTYLQTTRQTSSGPSPLLLLVVELWGFRWRLI